MKSLYTADFILNNSDLLIKDNCLVIDNILFEICYATYEDETQDVVRFFNDTDDYDYLTADNFDNSQQILDMINEKFKSKAVFAE